MSNKTYDVLKVICMIVGYMATFVLTLSDIWGFPYGTQIAATVSALGIFLGGILKASSDKYWETLADGNGKEDGEDNGN